MYKFAVIFCALAGQEKVANWGLLFLINLANLWRNGVCIRAAVAACAAGEKFTDFFRH
jgi:hypothetical protein